MTCSFRGLHRHFAWQALRFRHVVFCAFLKVALSGLRQVVTMRKLRGKRCVCDMLLKLTEASSRTKCAFWVSNV